MIKTTVDEARRDAIRAAYEALRAADLSETAAFIILARLTNQPAFSPEWLNETLSTVFFSQS